MSNLERTRHAGIFRRSGGTYVAVIPFVGADGKSKQKWITRRTLAAAKDARRDMLNNLDRGIRPDGATLALSEFLNNEWLPEVRRIRGPATAAIYEKMVRLHIVPALGAVRLRDLGRDHLRKFYRDLPTPALASYCHRILSAALGYAVRDLGILAANPCGSIRPPRWQSPETKALDVDEARALLVKVRGHDLEAAVILGMVGGLRVGECTAVKWSDLDLDSGSLVVAGSYTGPTKSGKTRELTLPASEVAALRRYRKDQAERLLRIGVRQSEGTYVVADPYGRQTRPQTLSAAFRRFARDNGVGLDRFHGLRHTAAVLMLVSGTDPKTAASRLGHANPALLITTYAHFVRSADRAAAERLESLLG